MQSNTIPLIIASLALLVALASFCVSLLVGWYTAIKPAQIIGDISYIVIWRFSSNRDGIVTDVAVTPAFWLRNSGALPVVIKDLRLRYRSENGASYESYPVSSVPLTAIENFTEFNEHGRLSSGSPFRGFSLTKSEQWTSAYRFHASSELLKNLVGKVKVMVEIYTNENPMWQTKIVEFLDFGKKPFHLQDMPERTKGDAIPIYTHRWKLRGQKTLSAIQ